MNRVWLRLSSFLLIFLLKMSSAAYAAAPVLFFSDLISGPNTGWEGSATKGAAVTIWGRNFGSVRSGSFVTVNGASLTNDSDYAEWGVSGSSLGIPRALQRITFWLNSSCTAGAGTISVTVGGVTSKTLPFTVRAGNIYFISITDGNDSYNGTRSTNQGSNNGPWRNALKSSPSNNSALRPGDCIYVRGGTYTQLDDQQMFVHIRSSTYSNGTASQPYAVSAYPGEIPTFDGTNATRGFNYPEGTTANYYTYSKLKFLNGYTAYGPDGTGNRMIGSWFEGLTANAWSGVIWVSDCQQTKILGNYWNNSGHDKYKHNIYAKSQPGGAGMPVQDLEIGWNEFSNPVSSEGYGGTVFLSKSSDFTNGNTDRIQLHDNYFHGGNCGDWIYVGDGTTYIDHVDIYNNIFSGGTVTNHGSIFWASGAGNGRIFNNTFYLTAPNMPVIYYSSSGTGGGTVQFKNNIYYVNNQAFFATENGNTFVVTSDYDLYYNSGGSTTVPSGVANLTVTNSRTGNPLFTNAAGADWSIASGSAAKDQGTSAVNTVLTTDFIGTPRPQGSVFDIGAYEFVSSGTADTTPPANPTGLRIGP
ncbi:MAG: choice-of-anchor Q domain-containing protein [Terriglobia bacterium]